jgi:nucleoside-diphosphate-sugar epimerase
LLCRRREAVQDLPDALRSAVGGVVVGDLRDPELPAVLRKRAPSDVTHVIHAAAEVRWNAPARAAHDANVCGTERVLEYARGLPRLCTFCHLSTAYVCGVRTGHIGEADALPDTFANAYEASKAAAERIVAESCPEALTVRPSIVLGASGTGAIARFRVFYPLLSAWNRGGLPVVIGDGGVPVDVVPVDWVARTILALMAVDARGPVHLVAGPRSPTLMEVMTALGASLNVLRLEHGRSALPVPAFLDPETYARFHDPMVQSAASARHRVILRAFDQYRPYLTTTRRFGNVEVRRALGGDYVPPPQLVEFAAPAVRYWWNSKGRFEREGSLRP